MSTSIFIQTTDHLTDKLQVKTIDDINPAVKNADLLTFAKSMFAMSKDSFVKAERIDKVELGGTPKPTRPMEVRLVTSAKVDGEYRSVTGTIANGVCSFDWPLNWCALNRLRCRSNSFADGFEVVPKLITEDLTVLQIVLHDKNYYTSTTTGAPNEVAFDFYLTDSQVGDVFNSTLIVPEDSTYAELTLPIVITIVEGE